MQKQRCSSHPHCNANWMYPGSMPLKACSLYLLYIAKSPLSAPAMDPDSPIKIAAFSLPTFKNHLTVLNNNPVAVGYQTATDNRKEKL